MEVNDKKGPRNIERSKYITRVKVGQSDQKLAGNGLKATLSELC